MSARSFSESVVEDATLAWLEALGYVVLHGPDIAAGKPGEERKDQSCRDVLLERRLRQSLARLNPELPAEALEDAFRKLTRLDGPTLLERNRAAYRMLVNGVTVEYRRADGSIAGDQVRVIDFEEPANNNWVAVSEFTVSDGQHTRRPDVVLFVNGLPLAVIELKNPTDENAMVWEKLKVASGGVVFTTIQKFFPEEKGDQHPVLSERRNIVVIADEAHRSQYDFIDGFARHMRDALPHASFVGFTGTPIEKTDANTRAVFGDYISVYDIQRAVADGATVPIYYESRLARLELSEAEKPHIDPEFDEATEGEEVERKEKLKSKWAQLEAVVGAERRLKLIARDLVEHYEKRYEAMDGKGMVVVMSRRIAVELYSELMALRPEWHGEDDDSGSLKVVMTGSASDPLEWQPHIRNKPRREALAQRFRDAKDPFRIVIVRDMWLTGFDAPSLHTMYVDKPMRGHGLMQAITRVNRVFKDKPGGLVVDYLVSCL